MRIYNAIFLTAFVMAATAVALPDKEKRSLNEELASANAVPHKQPGRGVIGYRLTSDPPLGSRFETLGLQSGDVLVSVNDKSIVPPLEDKKGARIADASGALTPAEHPDLKSIFEGNDISRVRVRRDGRELDLSFRSK